MVKKKWLIVFAVFVVLGIAAMATLCVGLFWVTQKVDDSLPVYTTTQIASAHPGYRRTTIVSGASVYVNDFEEYPLRLLNPEPTQMIGIYGASKVCAIPGLNQSNYIAADCGSEMPAYEIFRNTQSKPFDWRKATFQKMQFILPSGSGANLFSTNQALIADVIRTLRDGAPATAASLPISNTGSNIASVCLFSDQLPGIGFCPVVFVAPTGQVYVAESTPLVLPGPTTSSQTQWKAASQEFADWIKSR